MPITYYDTRADSDELRATAEESAADLREHHYWQKIHANPIPTQS